MSKCEFESPTPRSPEEFVPMIAIDEPLFLVGGQAVNLWGLYYHKQTIEFIPFVSRDMDVLGNRETVIKIAKLAGVEPQFFPMNPPTNEVGVVMGRSLEGKPLPVEVLSSIHGVKNEELHYSEYTMLIG